MSHKSCFLVGLAAALALACGAPSFGARPPKPLYVIRQLDLVDPSGVEYAGSGALDVNDPVETDGPYQAVGAVFTASNQESFPACWTISTVGGQLQSDLKLLKERPFSSATPTGINQLGEIVGDETTGADQEVGVYWADSNAVPQPLPILSTYDRSCAWRINNNGVICGWCSRLVNDADGQSHSESQPVLWRVNGGVVAGGPFELPISESAFAEAISDNNAVSCAKVVGSSFTEKAVEWTVLDSDGTLTVIGSRVLNADGTANAYGVNNDGAVCGTYYKQTTGRLAVVWAGSSMQALNIARFFCGPDAYDINNKGVIVGYAWSTRVSTEFAAVWPNATASMIVLNQFLDDNSPFSNLRIARAVNDTGAIVGLGWDGAVSTAYVAVPK